METVEDFHSCDITLQFPKEFPPMIKSSIQFFPQQTTSELKGNWENLIGLKSTSCFEINKNDFRSVYFEVEMQTGCQVKDFRDHLIVMILGMSYHHYYYYYYCYSKIFY
jgi:hypothetical protein